MIAVGFPAGVEALCPIKESRRWLIPLVMFLS
jgi:hypothetical protein